MSYAVSGGVRIHYEVEGSGAPLVLHTGFVSSLRDWYHLGYVDSLQGDYRLILIDPRGQGESDKPHETDAYSPERRVADVVAVLDALGIDRAHFWGYSLGGRIGFDLAKQAPERFYSLVLGGHTPFGSPPNVARAELLRRGMEAFISEGERAMGRPLPAEMRTEWLANDAEALAAATLVERPSLEADLSGMMLPALIYCGDQDPAYERAKRASELMHNAAFLSLPGLNHLQGVLRAELVLPHVRTFLQRVIGAPATTAERRLPRTPASPRRLITHEPPKNSSR